MKKIVLNWLAVLAWMLVIFYFSAQPNLKSELEPIWDLIFRKIAHMAEFFVLAFLLYRAYIGNRLTHNYSLLLGALVAVFYAIFDEYGHQVFVAGRVGSYIDVGVDSIGILSFILLQTYQLKQNKKS